MKDRARWVAEFVRSTLPEEPLECIDDPDAKKQWYLNATGGSPERVDSAVEALNRVMAGATPSEDELEVLEAIVVKDLCPTVEISGDEFTPPKGTWARLAKDHDSLKPFIRSAGRVECEGITTDYAGSGLLVAPDLVLTNRHVARQFASGIGQESLSIFYMAGFDFKREKSDPFGSERVDVTKVLLIHPFWDVAVLRVEPAQGRTPLALAAQPPAEIRGTDVAVIGYPYFRFGVDRYERDVLVNNFGEVPGFKRLQPGKLLEQRPFENPKEPFPRVLALVHNASTLGGNSGSLVVDLDAKRVLGIHFAGIPYKGNYCVPTWELRRDPRVRALGVQFDAQGPEPAPDPDVEKAWAALGAKSRMAPVPENIGQSAPRQEAAGAPEVAAFIAPGSGGGSVVAAPSIRIGIQLEISVRVLPPQIG